MDNNNFVLTRGPTDGRFSTNTPWSKGIVLDTWDALARSHKWMSWDCFRGTLGLILDDDGSAFDSCDIDPANGTGDSIKVGAIRAMLEGKKLETV